MRAWTSSVLTVSVSMLALTGCGKQPEPASDEVPDEKAKPATPEPEDEVDAGTEEPDDPDDPQPVSSSAAAGFAVGPVPASNPSVERLLVGEGAESLSNAGATVISSANAVPDAEGSLDVFVRVRVEFEGAGADAGLNHERPATRAEFERVFLGVREIAKLPDGRWLVDAQVSKAVGEDAAATTTDHSVIVVDPEGKTAALLWTGVDTSLSMAGACVSQSAHAFAVSGEELVVSKSEGTEFDAELAAELGMAADDCEVKAKTTGEVARVGLGSE